jgi:hypothetical protein
MMSLHPLQSTNDPDILTKRRGGGCLSIFGLPFLLAGLFVMQIPLRLIPLRGEGAPLPWYFFLLFGGVFATVGAVLVFGRRGLVIDRRRQVARKWWGLVVPMRRKEYPLERFERVELSHKPGDNEFPDRYPVHLSSKYLDKPLLIDAPTDYLEARSTAEFLARFLKRPLEDVSTGISVLRDHEYLDESLRERIQRTDEDVESLPPPPLEMRIKVKQKGAGVEIEIPGPRLSGPHVIPIIIVVPMTLYAIKVFISMFSSFPGPKMIKYGFAAFVGLIFIFPVVRALRHFLKAKGRSTHVTVNQAFLRVEDYTGRKMVVTEIPAGELRELALPTKRSFLEGVRLPGMKRTPSPGRTGTARMPDGRPVPRFVHAIVEFVGLPGITAMGNTERVTFGKGLSEAELLYLHALVRRTIAGE